MALSIAVEGRSWRRQDGNEGGRLMCRRTGAIEVEDTNAPRRRGRLVGSVVCDRRMSEPQGRRGHGGSGSSGSGRGRYPAQRIDAHAAEAYVDLNVQDIDGKRLISA